MARTKHKLKDVKLNEISFVGKGDNPGAHILLLKTHPVEVIAKGKEYDGEDKVDILLKWSKEQEHQVFKGDGEAATFAEIIQDKELRDKIWSMVWTLEDSISSIMYDDEVEDKSAMVAESVEQFKAAITTITKGGKKDMPGKTVDKTDMEKKVEELSKQVEELLAKNVELTGELDKAKAAKPCDDPTEGKEKKIDKSALPEDVRKYMEEQEIELKKNREDIEKMKAEAVGRECLSKAAEVNAVGSIDDITGIYKEVTPELRDKIHTLLKAADKRIKDGGLFKEIGKEDHSDGLSALDKITKKAEELRKTQPELTSAQAFTKVYDEDHELRAAYIKETR